ncbi:MAG TPA: CHRD domain-containing protein [Terriglobia bacterium]|nr:CHRD domain-containing protein [Terriglobia bacterium]
MSLKRTIAVLGIAVVLVWLALPAAAQTQERYKVRLATVPMDGGMRGTVAGTGSASAVLSGTKLTINGTFEGLRSPATIAKVHKGLSMGVRGSSFADLTVSKATNGTLAGTVDLTPEQVQSLKKGQLYIQISSEKAPEGNLWGWLVR